MALAEFLLTLPFPTENVRNEVGSKLSQSYIMMGQLSDLTKEECEEIEIGGIGLDVLMAGIHGGALERFLKVTKKQVF